MPAETMSTIGGPATLGRMGKGARFIPKDGMDVRNLSFGNESSVCFLNAGIASSILTIRTAAGYPELHYSLPLLRG